MIIFKQDSVIRKLFYSGVLNGIGTTLFNIVFVIYASHTPNAKVAIAAVGIISTVPYLLNFLLGYFADRINHKYKGLIGVRIFQIALYLILSLFINIEKNWLVFGLVLLINVLSDMLGTFSSYMQLPILNKHVRSEDLAKVRGTESGISQTLDLVGGPVGAFILTLIHFNFAVFALINAFSFFLSLIVLRNIKITESEREEKGNSESVYTFSKRNAKDIKENFEYIIKIKQLKHFLIIFTIFNLIGALQTTLLSITILNSKSLIMFNFGFTIATIETVEILGMIIGSVMPLKYFYSMTIEHNMIFEMLMFFLVSLTLVSHANIYFLLLIIFLSGYFAGISNPKIDAFIIQHLPEERIGGGMGAFYTVVTLGLPVGSACAGIISTSTTTINGWLCLLLLTIVSLVYLISLSMKYTSNV